MPSGRNPWRDPAVVAEMYQLRGEIVAVGSAIELITRELAASYGDATARTGERRCWEMVKVALRTAGLTDKCQVELAALAAYFEARRGAAHGFMMLAALVHGDRREPYMLRILNTSDPTAAKPMGIADLRADRDTARSGLDALNVVARRLVEHDPVPLTNAVHGLIRGRWQV